MNKRCTLRALLSLFGVIILAGFAFIMPCLTTLGFIHTEHSSEIGYEDASFWHSGLPFRFLTRSDISMGVTFDPALYWSDVAFWFVVSLLLAAATRCWFRNLHASTAAQPRASQR